MIVQYSVELDKNRHPTMVMEKAVDYGTTVISCSEDAKKLLQEVFRADKQAEEHVYLISLNTRKRVLGVFDVAHGQAAGCGISPRELFLRALVSGAVSIVVGHNHPGGDPTPSTEDNTFTELIKEAGTLLNIQLDDSIIIGDGVYYSYRDSGLL